MKKTSRVRILAEKEERATVKRIFYLSFLSVILAIFVFTLGIPLLGKFAEVLNTFLGKKEESKSEKSIVRPPTFNPLPQATNSAKLIVSGFSDEETIIDIYLNSEKIDKTEVRDGKFIYEELFLKNGENKISAKAITKSGLESDFSQTETVIFDKEEPSLEIEKPQDGQSFSSNNRILVSGKTDADAQVYANGFLASVNIEGKFEVFVPVAEGESTIEIKAIDEAGNLKVEKRKITYHK